ncbi:MAG TPA: hypothetical protein VHC19_22125, partial [Pirellulales bacterium]|nr:hypothetical protein [Pirellulales bacterium]
MRFVRDWLVLCHRFVLGRARTVGWAVPTGESWWAVPTLRGCLALLIAILAPAHALRGDEAGLE